MEKSIRGSRSCTDAGLQKEIDGGKIGVSKICHLRSGCRRSREYAGREFCSMCILLLSEGLCDDDAFSIAIESVSMH